MEPKYKSDWPQVLPHIIDPDMIPINNCETDESPKENYSNNSFFQEHKFAVIVSIILLLIIVVVLFMFLTRKNAKKKAITIADDIPKGSKPEDVNLEELKQLRAMRRKVKFVNTAEPDVTRPLQAAIAENIPLQSTENIQFQAAIAENIPLQAAEARQQFQAAEARQQFQAAIAENRPLQAAEARQQFQAAENRPLQAAENRPLQAAEARQQFQAAIAENRPLQAAENRPLQAAENSNLYTMDSFIEEITSS